MKKCFFILFMIFNLVSCDFLNDVFFQDNYLESVSFGFGSYSVEKGNETVLYVQASPSDAFEYYDTDFEVSNSLVCGITERNGNWIIVKGISKGSTIITCKMGSKECKTVVNVTDLTSVGE